MPEEEENQDPGLYVEVQGKGYMLKLKDYRASDDRKLRAQINMTVMEAFDQAGNGAMDALAGLLWLMRLRTEPRLAYDKVADEIGFREFESIRPAAEVEMEQLKKEFEGLEVVKAVDANPEAPGANS